VRDGVIRHCAICDAYELQGARLAVLGNDPKALGTSLFLTSYTAEISLCSLTGSFDLTETERELAATWGIRIIDAPLVALSQRADGLALRFSSDEEINVDALYPALGSEPRSHLAGQMGIRLHEDGRIVVDSHQRTSHPRCYAAGDIVTGLNQIAVAMAQGEVAAVDIHNRLRSAEGRSLDRSQSRRGL